MDTCPACRAQCAHLQRELTPAADAPEDPGTDEIARALAQKMRRRKRCLRTLGAALAVLLSALFPTILGNLVQVYAQPKVDPSKAAVIYTMEGVLATIISIMLGMEEWSISVLAGGALILAAVLVIQFGGKKNAGQ